MRVIVTLFLVVKQTYEVLYYSFNDETTLNLSKVKWFAVTGRFTLKLSLMRSAASINFSYLDPKGHGIKSPGFKFQI